MSEGSFSRPGVLTDQGLKKVRINLRRGLLNLPASDGAVRRYRPIDVAQHVFISRAAMLEILDLPTGWKLESS